MESLYAYPVLKALLNKPRKYVSIRRRLNRNRWRPVTDLLLSVSRVGYSLCVCVFCVVCVWCVCVCCAHHQQVKFYYTVSGIVTLCRWPSGAQVERGVLTQPAQLLRSVLSHRGTSFNELISTFLSTTGKKVHICCKKCNSLAAEGSAVHSIVLCVFVIYIFW